MAIAWNLAKFFNSFHFNFSLQARKVSKLCQLLRLQSRWLIWTIKYSWQSEASKLKSFPLNKNVCSSDIAITYREFLGQAWMKSDKKFRAEHIIQMTKRFNDGSRLVGSEIVSRWALKLFGSKVSNLLCISGERWQLVLQRLRSGQQSLTFAVACTISTVFCRFVLLLQVLQFSDWRRLGTKFQRM